VVVLPIADRHLDYARSVEARLKAAGLRWNSTVPGEGELQDPGGPSPEGAHMLVVGDKEAADGAVAVRSRAKGDLGPRPSTPSSPMLFEVGEKRPILKTLRTEASYRFLIVIAPGVARSGPHQRADSRPEIPRDRRDGPAVGDHAPPQRSRARVQGPRPRSRSRHCRPPVCESWITASTSTRSQATREAKKHQKVIEVKEIKFRPKVDEQITVQEEAHSSAFLEEGDKSSDRLLPWSRDGGIRDRAPHLDALIEELNEVAVPETMPRQEGNRCTRSCRRRRRQAEAQARRDRGGNRSRRES